MNLISHVNSDAEVAGIAVDSTSIQELGALAPVTATPAALAAGVVAGAGLVGAAAAGAAVGEAVD